MVEFCTDKEVLQIMGNCVDFVSELIDYIAEYPDDDYMTMECLCRKLVKYGLIEKADGYYRVAEQTEPQSGYCNECKWHGDKQVCSRCRSRNLYAPKTEPQTELIAQIHEMFANMEKLLRKSSAEIVGAIREEVEKQTDCQWK